MPLVEITLTAGRDPKVLRELIHRVHDAVQTSLNANSESIRVVVREVPRSLWAAGDQSATGGPGDILKELTHERRHLFQSAGLFDRMSWKLT